jgi:membrane fusion protein, multidrug efflux system
VPNARWIACSRSADERSLPVKRIPVWLIVVVALAILVAGKVAIDETKPAAGTRAAGAGAGAGGKGAPTAVQIAVLKSEKLADKISSVGTILPNERIDVRTEISGRVREIRFKEGARVKKGDLLVKIDDRELAAQLAKAKSELEISKKENERQSELYSQKVSSQREFDTAANNLGVAQAQFDLISVQINKTSLRAPFDGVVGLRNVSEGEFITSSTLITTLSEDKPVKVDFTVPERYASNVEKGDVVHFTVEGTSRVFDATVYALESIIDPETRSLGVRAMSPNADGALVPGAFAEVQVLMPERVAVTVPSFTLVPELRGQHVFLYHGGKASAVTVKTGLRTEDRVEITNGLAAGDTLITSGILQLKPGAPVTITTD